VHAWPTATWGAAHYCAALRPTAVAAAHDRAARLGAARAAAQHACSTAVTSPTREVADYALGVVALDSDGETVVAAMLTGVVRMGGGSGGDAVKDSEATGTYGEWRGVSGGIRAETMMAPGDTAHLAWHGLAAAACDARTVAVDGSLGCGRQSVAAGDEEARRSRGGGARAVAWATALRSDTGELQTRGRSERIYTRAHGIGQHRPAQPIGARHRTTLTMTSGPVRQRFSNFNKLRNRSLTWEK
jgi:hypothetical protein